MITIDKQELIEFIKGLNPNFIENYVTPSGVTIDLYNATKKYGFRLSGFQWLPNDNPRQAMIKCNKDGIRVIHIYDFEWYNCKDNFKEFIKSFVNSRGKHMIRSNEVVEIDSKSFTEFLKNNHLYVDTIKGCTVMYGIYDNGELVAVSGFNQRNAKNYNWEWRRFAIRYGWMTQTNVAQLFLDKFRENHKGKLVDYQQCDRFNFTTDSIMGFTKTNSSSGVVSINCDTMNYTRHSFIPEKGMNKQETMEYYGFTHEVKTCGTNTWIIDL